MTKQVTALFLFLLPITLAVAQIDTNKYYLDDDGICTEKAVAGQSYEENYNVDNRRYIFGKGNDL